LPLKVLNAQGEFNDHDAAIYAIDYAIEHDARIINCSWNVYPPGEKSPPTLEAAIDRAASRGILVVVAAGNDQENIDRVWYHPASLRKPNLITVMAVRRDGKPSWFSNYGKSRVHLAAPGGEGGDL